jgi:hypothetical protein
MLGLLFRENKILEREFKDEFEQHGLSRPILISIEMQRDLRYALFLRGLTKKGWSRDVILRLIKIAETVRPPESPIRTAGQYTFVVYLMSLSAGLTLDFFKQQTPEKGWTVLLIGAVLGVIIIALSADRWMMFTRPLNRHQEIHRFLQLAEMDIEKPQSINI